MDPMEQWFTDGLQAVEAYKGAVRADGAHHEAALALAKLHLDKGVPGAGRAVCAQLLAAQPNNVEAQLLMVQVLSTQVRKKSGLVSAKPSCTYTFWTDSF